MAAGLRQGSHHAGQVVDGGKAVANKKNAQASVGAARLTAARSGRATAQGYQHDTKERQAFHHFTILLYIGQQDGFRAIGNAVRNKFIRVTASALASLLWVRYNNPPDLEVLRIQQGKISHASLYLPM
jgi:hypothetical protein